MGVGQTLFDVKENTIVHSLMEKQGRGTYENALKKKQKSL